MKKLLVITALSLAVVGGMASTASAWSYDSYGNWVDYGDYSGQYCDNSGGGGGGGTTSAPEPASLLMLGSGFVGLWVIRQLRAQRSIA